MGLRINTNIASISAQRNLNAVSSRLQGNFSRLSSGLRIASASDDAAGLGISEKMRSQIRSFAVAGRNAQDGISLTQTAEGALGEVSNILGRLRELAVQSTNGTLSTTDRATINTEATALISEVSRIASSTEFNGVNLLDGTNSSASIQVGIDSGQTISVTLQNTTTGSGGLNISGVALDTAANASTALSDPQLDPAASCGFGLEPGQRPAPAGAVASRLEVRSSRTRSRPRKELRLGGVSFRDRPASARPAAQQIS